MYNKPLNLDRVRMLATNLRRGRLLCKDGKVASKPSWAIDLQSIEKWRNRCNQNSNIEKH